MFGFSNYLARFTNSIYNMLNRFFGKENFEPPNTYSDVQELKDSNMTQITRYKNSESKNDLSLENFYCPYHCDCILNYYCDLLNKKIGAEYAYCNHCASFANHNNSSMFDICLKKKSKNILENTEEHRKPKVLMKVYIPIKRTNHNQKYQLKYGIDARYQKKLKRLFKKNLLKCKLSKKFKNHTLEPVKDESKNSEQEKCEIKNLKNDSSNSSLQGIESKILCLNSKSSKCVCDTHQRFCSECLYDDCRKISSKTLDKSVSTSSFLYFSDNKKYLKLVTIDKKDKLQDHKCIICGIVSRLCKKFEEKSNKCSQNDNPIKNQTVI